MYLFIYLFIYACFLELTDLAFHIINDDKTQQITKASRIASTHV